MTKSKSGQSAQRPHQSRLRVAVIYGGRSAEHDISLISARFVAESLDPEVFDVVPVGISRSGAWVLPEGGRAALAASSLEGLPVTAEADATLVRREPHAADHPPIDVVFPVLHGPFGEDGTMQGFLELAGLPYVGAGVLGSAIGMDKAAQKQLLISHDIPTPPFIALRRVDWEQDRETILEIVDSNLEYPVFVKPANLGSSIGITKVVEHEQLAPAIELATQYDLRLVIEQGLENVREIECAVLGNDEPVASVLGEIRTSSGFYDYDSKYIDDSAAELIIPADLPTSVSETVQDLALQTFIALDCAGMARVDFFVNDNDGAVWVNEVNTIPGFTPISMFPRLWEASGVPARELVSRLVDLAIERHEARRSLRVER